jgi:SAM-dependent methyltransferase
VNITNTEPIWKSVGSLAEALQKSYSVTGKEAIRDQYLEQVKQYPLYLEWFDRIISQLDKQEKPIGVLEYGPGPGLLAERIVQHPNVETYLAVEPEQIFREMTAEKTGSLDSVIEGTAEGYSAPGSADLVVATAAYHHFSDKPKALKNAYELLRQGGKIIIADVFLPDYRYGPDYNPLDKTEFIEKVMEYAAAQIKSMPNPQAADIVDQIKTAFLDILRVEELKVCLPIIQNQLSKAGFKHVKCELMIGEDGSLDYKNLGYYFITAKRRDRSAS